MRSSNGSIEEFCDEYLLPLITLGNVRPSVQLLFACCDNPLVRSATLLLRWEDKLQECNTHPTVQVSAVATN